METLGSLLTMSRERLAEASPRQWSNQQLRRWIMDGARDIARKAECLQTTDDVAMVEGTQEYTLPDGVVRVYRVESRPDGDSSVQTLEYRDFHNMDEVWWSGQTQGSSNPMWFTMWGFPPQLKMVVYPTPSADGLFKIFYYKLPTALDVNDAAIGAGLDDAENVELPEGWHDLTLEYCEYLALRKDADPRWQEAKGLYEEHLNDLIVTAIRWTDQAGAVAVGGTMVPRWLWDEGYY